MSKIPAYYIPHGGGPCFFMDWNPQDTWDALGTWLGSFAAALPEKPRAVLFFSAHWEEPEFTLLTTPKPDLYYDYYDFPPHTYELEWPAPAAPQFFGQVQDLLAKANIPYDTDSQRDFDHGVFIPGKLMFPQATIPTLQISLRKGLLPAAHIALGHALAPLRNQGVLFVGSGMSYHNMRRFRFGDNNPIVGSDLFNTWLTKAVCRNAGAERDNLLMEWENAPGARAAHPREEHLLPLMVIAGAAGQAPAFQDFSCVAMGASLSAYRFD